MLPAGWISILIIAVTFIVSYSAFKNRNLFTKLQFEVDKILVHKDFKRLITAAFVHVNWMHLIFNLVALFFFSFGLEATLGALAFTIIYFASIVGGNLLALLIHKKDAGYSVVGASGAINGIIFASIAVNPYITILFLPGWLFALIYVGFSIYGIRSQQSNIGHEAHLGGAIIGMLVAILFYPTALTENWLPILLVLIPCLVFIIVILRKPHWILVQNTWHNQTYNYTVDDRYNAKEKNTQQEVDRILEKIHRKGINSLSRKEKEILEEFSKK
ncbi:MAG: rhomboid family intramembrane serine protease [Sphingobacteriales bacterium]|nr:MAG: rhomboid family intramembrane serine protease [Sphingobacteriales bacterium]